MSGGHRRRLRRAGAAAAATTLLLAGCGTAGGPRTASDGGEDITLVVYAAASLQEPFEELGEEFEASHPGVEVDYSFAGSSTLVAQIQQGAPADVLATADTATMDDLVSSGLEAAAPVDIATNTLRIAVPAGNPAGITDLTSLTEEGVNLVVCAPAVPCGAATETVAQAADLEFSPVSEEQSVTDVLTKVSSGEADAGLVYVTDIARSGDAVEGIDAPGLDAAVNRYPITTVEGSAHPELGQEFVDLVAGEQGRQVLAGYGFASP